MEMSLRNFRELAMQKKAVHGVTKSQPRLSTWTECGAGTQTDLDTVTLSESEEKDKYVLPLPCAILKMVQMNLCAKEKQNHRHRNKCTVTNEESCCSVAKSCPTLCDPMDCSPPGSSVPGNFQAKILEWVAISSSRGSSWTRDQTLNYCIGRKILYHWAAKGERRGG